MGADDFRSDIFVSRRGSQAAVAREVVATLVEAGWDPGCILAQDKDMPAGVHFLERMHEAADHARHILIVLSADYDRSPYTRTYESLTFLTQEGAGSEARRVIVLRAEECTPPGRTHPPRDGPLGPTAGKRTLQGRAGRGGGAGARGVTCGPGVVPAGGDPWPGCRPRGRGLAAGSAGGRRARRRRPRVRRCLRRGVEGERGHHRSRGPGRRRRASRRARAREQTGGRLADRVGYRRGIVLPAGDLVQPVRHARGRADQEDLVAAAIEVGEA